MALVFSPSNMDTYRLCPRRFQAYSITKEAKWKSTKNKSRGSLVHGAVQKALKEGLQSVSSWPDGIDIYYTQQMIQEAREKTLAGQRLFIEHELAINKNYAPCGWWDDDAYLRARADIVLVPSTDYALFGGDVLEVNDIKTGKKWDDIDFQLRIEVLLAHLIYNVPVVNYNYWYVDIGETDDGSVDFRNGMAPMKDIIDQLKDMSFAIKNTYFPARKNKFCKWCGLHQTPACGA